MDLDADSPGLVPPARRYRCDACGGGGLDSTSQTCTRCEGLGFC